MPGKFDTTGRLFKSRETDPVSSRRYCSCSVCGDRLMRSQAGVNSHLRAHVRLGELDGELVSRTRSEILGFEFKQTVERTAP